MLPLLFSWSLTVLVSMPNANGYLTLHPILQRNNPQYYRWLPLALSDSNDIFSSQRDDGEEQNPPVITKEMFLLDLLQPSIEPNDIRIKKKGSKGNKKGGFQEYKVFDNRDTMPFAVTLQTPDPYTHPDVKKKNANKVKRRNNAIEEQIVSRVLMPGSSTKGKSLDSNAMTLLGEFTLDKHTTTGDSLMINNVEYKVTRHRCQYKYAGGQRFVMVRKILEVKEVSRIQTEEYLLEQLRKS